MRIEGIDRKRASWVLKPIYALMRRQFGKVLTPYTVLAHRPGVALGMIGVTVALEAGKALDRPIKHMVSLRAAQLIGCPF
jgi:alkylhydroperoxidase family enzyme